MSVARPSSLVPSKVTGRGSALAARDVAYVVAAVFAVAWVYVWVSAAIRDGSIGFDFEGTLWEPGSAILAGENPYPQPTATEVGVGNPALYPPLLMIVVAPFTVLPWSVAVLLWLAVLGASIAVTLRLLGVRDPRCHVFAFLSAPVVNGLIWGNATLLLVPMVALAWRWRGQWLRTGAVVGLAIAIKLFLWPLLFWLLGTRRYRASGAAFASAVLGVLIPWAVIGFNGFANYPELLRAAEHFYAVHGYSIATMVSAVGVETEVATRVALAAGCAIGLLSFAVGRRGRDEAAISLAVLAAILGSPILWEYYYALLLVPIAIMRPRFSAVWAVLPLFYLTHRLPRPRLLSTAIEPGGFACCKPEDVPLPSWVFNHAPAGLWPALGHATLATLLVGALWWSNTRSTRDPSFKLSY